MPRHFISIAHYRIQIVSRQRYSAKDAAVVSDCVRVCAEAPGRDSVCVSLRNEVCVSVDSQTHS